MTLPTPDRLADRVSVLTAVLANRRRVLARSEAALASARRRGRRGRRVASYAAAVDLDRAILQAVAADLLQAQADQFTAAIERQLAAR